MEDRGTGFVDPTEYGLDTHHAGSMSVSWPKRLSE